MPDRFIGIVIAGKNRITTGSQLCNHLMPFRLVLPAIGKRRESQTEIQRLKLLWQPVLRHLPVILVNIRFPCVRTGPIDNPADLFAHLPDKRVDVPPVFLAQVCQHNADPGLTPVLGNLLRGISQPLPRGIKSVGLQQAVVMVK